MRVVVAMWQCAGKGSNSRLHRRSQALLPPELRVTSVPVAEIKLDFIRHAIVANDGDRSCLDVVAAAIKHGANDGP